MHLRAPSGTLGDDLWLVVKESKIQPGLLVLQMLGHVRGNGVIPEAAGHRDRHLALGTAHLPSHLCFLSCLQMGKPRPQRGRAALRVSWQARAGGRPAWLPSGDGIPHAHPDFFHSTFCFDCTACRILVPGPGIEPVPPEVEAWSCNYWTTKEVPSTFFPRS